jgi:hypothetical protein
MKHSFEMLMLFLCVHVYVYACVCVDYYLSIDTTNLSVKYLINELLRTRTYLFLALLILFSTIEMSKLTTTIMMSSTLTRHNDYIRNSAFNKNEIVRLRDCFCLSHCSTTIIFVCLVFNKTRSLRRHARK